MKATLTFRIAYPRALAEAVLMLRPGPLAERNMLTEISPKNVNSSVVFRDKERGKCDFGIVPSIFESPLAEP